MSSFVPPADVRGRRSEAQNRPVADFLSQIADAALVAVMFVVPCLLGGVPPSAQLLLGVLTLIAAGAWLLGQVVSRDSGWNWLGVEPIIVLGIALLVLQVTPLPLEWRDRLSPELSRLLAPPTDAAAVGPPEWRTLSVTPAATRHALANFVAYAVLFLVAAQRVRSAADARRMLVWIAAAACAMAAFGLVQFLFSNGKFFWHLSVPFVDTSEVVHGSFVNRNHLAQFLALGIGPLLMLALAPQRQGVQPQRLAGRHRGHRLGDRTAVVQAAAWCGLAVILAAIALSMSRGGMMAAGAALIACLCVCQRSRLLDDRFLVGAFVLGAALVAALFLPGARQLEARISEEVASLDLEKIDAGAARRKVWEAVVQGIKAFPLTGAGVGSHRHVYPLYFDHVDDGTVYTTAESGYLQIGLEAGGAGLTLLLAGIGLGALRMLRAAGASRDREKTACLAATLAGIAATTAQGVVETHWYMPGCMALLAPLAGVGVGLSSPGGGGVRAGVWRLPRIVWAGGLAGLAWCATAAFPVHQRALQNAAHWTKVAAASDAAVLEVSEGNAPGAALSRRELEALSDLDSTLPSAHLALAKLHLQAFEERQRDAENPMSLGELRQACTAAEFASSEERREWLQRATAGNVELLIRAREHVQRCLAMCPFEGRAYLYAADLCFIDGGTAATQQSLIADARRLRPYHAQVDFAAGQLAWQSGRLDEALQHWRKSYDRSPMWRRKIAQLLINYMPAAEFLRTFEPDWQTLRELQHEMAQAGHAEYPLVARRFADASVARAHEVMDGSEETLLREALNIYRRLGDEAAVAACALQAVRFAPGSYDAHASAARALQALGRNAEALTHLRWCLQRKPNDRPLSDLFRAVMDRASREEALVLTDFAAEGRSSAPAEIETASFDVSHSGAEGSGNSQHDAGPRDVSNPLKVGRIKERNR